LPFGTSLIIRESAPQPIFHQCDLRDISAIDAVFKEHEGKGGIWAVVHLAALKAVGESGEIPLDYYKVNVGGSLNLFEVSHRASYPISLQ
jgi:UDP-glucose 4-epimerase